MEEFFKRILEDLFGRIEGPFWMRFILQPLISSLIGLRAAVKDAHLGRLPYVWSSLKAQANRRALLKQSWKEIEKVFIVAIIIDVIYQAIILHSIHPLQAVLIGVALALAPYALIRGSVSRIMNLWRSTRTKHKTIPVREK